MRLSIIHLLCFSWKEFQIFSSRCIEHNNVCLCDGTFNCLWKLFFLGVLRMICQIDFKYGSINFERQRKWPTKYQYLGIAPLKISKDENLVKISTICSLGGQQSLNSVKLLKHPWFFWPLQKVLETMEKQTFVVTLKLLNHNPWNPLKFDFVW